MEEIIKAIQQTKSEIGDKEVDVSWKKKTLDELFYITGSKTTAKLKLEKIGFGEYPYITTKATNNGCNGFYNFYTEKGNCLTIDSAVAGSCFYQKEHFSASDHVEVLRPKDTRWNKNTLLFIKVFFDKKIANQFNYSIKCNQQQIAKITIKIPLYNNQPDFEYMDNFIRDLKGRMKL